MMLSQKKHESLHQEAMRAWEEYRKTGLRVTAEEVIAWLKTWGTNDETAPPPCHT